MFKKILIANRGEIAVRIIRACKEWGISTVAVHSDVDRESMHVRLADESICIGSHQPVNSYLNIPAIMSAIELTNSEAVHPGYGFLSENPDLAYQCEKNNIIFIGPTKETLNRLGNKTSAKEVADDAGVRTIPSVKINEENKKTIHDKVNKIGYPVIVKASWGGGGRGMRVVRSPDDLLKQIELAQSESKKACLLYTSPSPRDYAASRMPSSA